LTIAAIDDDAYNGWPKDLEQPMTPRTEARMAKLYAEEDDA
jgi:hypothetical protein